MKGILIFNRINDLIFMKFDKEFENYIYNLGIKNGFLSENSQYDSGINRNVVVQVFSPLITSQRVMQTQFQNPYSSTECEDGTTFAFSEHVGYFFVQITKESSSSAAVKELTLFVESVKFLCGVSVDILSDLCVSQHEGCLAHRLIMLVETWDHLRITEQMYLTEGIERLLVNRITNSTCIDILETVLAKMRTTNKGQLLFCHAFFLVGVKLLSLFSSRNAGELSKGSLLQLIALSQALQTAGCCSSDGIVALSNSQVLDRSAARDMPESSVMSPSLLRKLVSSSKLTDESSSALETVDVSEVQEGLRDHLKCQLIFLKTKQNICSPHIMYSLNVSGQLSLVIVCEIINKTIYSSCLVNCLLLVHTILNSAPSGRCLLSKTSLQPAFQKLIDAQKKLKISLDLDRFARTVARKWELLKHSGLMSILQKSQDPLPPQVETLLCGLCQSLQDAFEYLVLRVELQHQVEPQHPTLLALHLSRLLALKKLGDYIEYLTVKAQRNITMTTYLQDYPGLLHFIYIDRTTNCMLAPSVGECIQLRQEYVASLTKENVWKMVEIGQRHLQKGDLVVLWQDESFYYSYFLWFEDLTGKPLKPKKFPNLKSLPIPGIACGDFYRTLVNECFPSSASVQCFELYCIHVGVSTPPFILEQARRLASSIWETASLANSLVMF